MSEAPPLMLCMEKADGQEVTMQIQPTDDFHSFLLKARSLIGYDVDINSITHNQPVALTDNIYQFLLNSEQSLSSELNKPIMPSANTEDLYILDDGTQIRASQIHFDNEDPPVDLSLEKIPFVRFSNDGDDLESEENIETESKIYNIVDSPVRGSKDIINNLVIPFQLVQYNPYKLPYTSSYAAQFTKYLEIRQQAKTYATLNTVTNRNKSPRSLIRDNFKSIDDSFQRNNDDYTHYTREDILNMFKDAPVPSIPCENQANQGFLERRRHIRKTDPSRLGNKSIYKPISYINVDGVLIAESESQNCFICSKFVDNNRDKLYLFDNEDQRLHRSSPQRKLSTQLKIICEQCLESYFTPCRKSPNQSLNSDEFLVIRNNQQYIFQKTSCFYFNIGNKKAEPKAPLRVTADNYKKDVKDKFDVLSDKVVISTKDAVIENENGNAANDDKGSSSDVEIIENEPEFDDIDNLEDADEEVIEFLGKYQCDNSKITELKCRFCSMVFSEITAVIEHGDIHKHVMDDDEVFPCPLCDYGYANFKWLKGHLKAAHGKSTQIKTEIKTEDSKTEQENKDPKESSPTAKRTESSNSKPAESEGQKEVSDKPEVNQAAVESRFEIKTEVKQETLDSSDEEIWIVQAADDADSNANKPKRHKCDNCSLQYSSAATLSAHKCRRRGRKLKNKNDVIIPTQDDFLKKPRKRKYKEPSSDPKIVTCHNCNESFTSKVRLKFHMQFHESTSMLTPEGDYLCPECPSAKFTTETALFDHVHFQHHKQRRWQCPVAHCGKTFYLRATLTKHSRTHTDTRRYVCGTCGKRFLDKQTLDEHGVTHLRIKPFQCHICLKQLTRRSRLRMHLRAHEEELCPRLVLVCAVCARAFRDHVHVQEHLTASPECIEEFARGLKEEEEVQLSPTSGLVRHAVQVVESPILPLLEGREAHGPEAAALLGRVPEAAHSVIRCVRIEKAFRCEYCEDVFFSESGLNKHRVIHKNVKNPFICHICKVSFATYSRCTTHKTTHGFYKRSLAVAKQQGETNKLEAGPSSTGILGYGDFPVVKHFLCEDCGRSYLHWTYLQVHRRMKHATDNFTYKCPQCDLTFVNSWSLSYHRKKHHCKGDQDDGSNTSKTREREDYRIPCRDCDEVLPNKTALYKHRKKEHSDMSLMNHKTGLSPDVAWAPACGACGGCGACARRPNCTTANHTDSTRSYESVTCDVCNKSFPDAAALGWHARCHAPHAHACGVCGHAFRTLSMLAEHTRVHSGERPYPCDICGVAFRRSTAMRNHRLIHSGVRAWACSRCPKRFRIRSDLRTHLRLKHPATLYVIEVQGLNPSPEEVMKRLSMNNIPYDKVIEITKMSFPKNTTSVIPSCSLALSMLSHRPRTPVAAGRARPQPPPPPPTHQPLELYQPTARRGRGIAKNPRKSKPQRGDDLAYTVVASAGEDQQCAETGSQQTDDAADRHPPASVYPATLNASQQELSDLNMQLLLRERALLDHGHAVLDQLQLNQYN